MTSTLIESHNLFFNTFFMGPARDLFFCSKHALREKLLWLVERSYFDNFFSWIMKTFYRAHLVAYSNIEVQYTLKKIFIFQEKNLSELDLPTRHASFFCKVWFQYSSCTYKSAKKYFQYYFFQNLENDKNVVMKLDIVFILLIFK